MNNWLMFISYLKNLSSNVQSQSEFYSLQKKIRKRWELINVYENTSYILASFSHLN